MNKKLMILMMLFLLFGCRASKYTTEDIVLIEESESFTIWVNKHDNAHKKEDKYIYEIYDLDQNIILREESLRYPAIEVNDLVTIKVAAGTGVFNLRFVDRSKQLYSISYPSPIAYNNEFVVLLDYSKNSIKAYDIFDNELVLEDELENIDFAYHSITPPTVRLTNESIITIEYLSSDGEIKIYSKSIDNEKKSGHEKGNKN